MSEEPAISNKKPNYIFGDLLGNAMSKVSLRVQYEASMMSMALMSIGLVITVIYFIIYFDFKVWYKVFLAINGVAGLMFMISSIITTLQQYQSYIQATQFKEDMKGGIEKDA